MPTTQLRSRIVGTGSAVPEKRLTNADLEKIVDTSDEWITRRSGIKERRISSTERAEKTTDLAAAAARRAMEMADMDPKELDMIVIGTITPDRNFPSCACGVQAELGAINAHAYDVSAGCSGFLFSLAQADNAIKTGSVKTALVMGAERLSTIVNWEDRGTCVLLGDGAGGVVLRAGQGEEGILSTHLKSDGRHWDLLYSEQGTKPRPDSLPTIDQKDFYLIMEGNRLFKVAIRSLVGIAREAMEVNGLTGEDVTAVVPHQANIRIIEAMAGKLGISMDKIFTNIHNYGNTSSASIPLALDEANRAGRLKKGDIVLLEAFGAGLTWGSTLIKWAF